MLENIDLKTIKLTISLWRRKKSNSYLSSKRKNR